MALPNRLKPTNATMSKTAWATTSGMGLDYDFDSIRVFSWGLRRKHYETSYIEHNLRGYYPILVSKNPEGFSYTSENKQGQRVPHKFLLQGNRLKRIPVL